MASLAFSVLAVSLLVAPSSAAPKSPKLSITIPEECKGKEFCSIKPEGYDEIEKQINSILPPFNNDIREREGYPWEDFYEVETDEDNCPAEVTRESVYVYIHPDSSKKPDIIVQTKLLPQIIVTVTCKNKNTDNSSEGGQKCFTRMGYSSFNKHFTCQESKATRSLLVYDPKLNGIVTKNYTIPVCCSCQIVDL